MRKDLTTHQRFALFANDRARERFGTRLLRDQLSTFSDEELDWLLDQNMLEFLRIGLCEDDEPNEYGLFLEGVSDALKGATDR